MLIKKITNDLKSQYYSFFPKDKITFKFPEVITIDQLDELSKFMGYNLTLFDAYSYINKTYNFYNVEYTTLWYKILHLEANVKYTLDIENLNKVTKEVIDILKINTTDGGYLVGGCVRDALLGLTPKDYDFTTETPISTLGEVFKEEGFKVDEVGLAFNVLIVTKDKEQFEIANFREDSLSSDGRKPDYVLLGTINTDGARRDFGLNSLYYSLIENTLLDPTHQGISDFLNKKLKFIGNPKDRLKEDRLRAFRFYRFMNKLSSFGFEVDKKSLKAVRESITESYILLLSLEKDLKLANLKLEQFKCVDGQDKFDLLMKERSIINKKLDKFISLFKAVAPSRIINEIERMI